MKKIILSEFEIEAIYAMDYVSDLPIEKGMHWNEVRENIIAFPAFGIDWDPTDPACCVFAA